MNTLKKYEYSMAVGLLIAMHFFGALGMQWEVTQMFFLTLTPLNLVYSLFFLLYFENNKNYHFYRICALIAFMGFMVEWAGVHTGKIFGIYHYGSPLGFQIDEIPILIGINWLMLIVAFSAVLHTFHPMLKIAGTALGMTLLDISIEPIAIKYQFWIWKDNIVPLQNYIAWFMTAFVLAFFYSSFRKTEQNPFAVWLILAQFLFFGMGNFSKIYEYF